MVNEIIEEIKSNSSENYAKFHRKMIQSEKGYGKGDLVIGCSMPNLRRIAQKHNFRLSLKNLSELIQSQYHEARTLALIIMINKFHTGDEPLRKSIVEIYLDNIKFINNWDLVDISSSHIIGAYFKIEDPIFERLSTSNSLWENRISIVSTHAFIKQNNFDLTLRLCERFMKHEHHLIHKACGWMLREIGKRNESVLLNFLRKYHAEMPRIMFSYAKERLKNVQI
jgi:3-methyladenine DNA glycosylase AlkD